MLSSRTEREFCWSKLGHWSRSAPSTRYSAIVSGSTKSSSTARFLTRLACVCLSLCTPKVDLRLPLIRCSSCRDLSRLSTDSRYLWERWYSSSSVHSESAGESEGSWWSSTCLRLYLGTAVWESHSAEPTHCGRLATAWKRSASFCL